MSGVSEALHSRATMSAGQRCLAAGQRTLVRGLRSFMRDGSRAGQAGGLRLGGRLSTQQGAFSTSRVIFTASSAATDNVETATPPATGEAGAVAAAVGSAAKPFQSTAYPFTDIEAKWQAYWEEHKTFRTPEFHELDTSKPKFYALDMFPYPRCAGVEVGAAPDFAASCTAAIHDTLSTCACQCGRSGRCQHLMPLVRLPPGTFLSPSDLTACCGFWTWISVQHIGWGS